MEFILEYKGNTRKVDLPDGTHMVGRDSRASICIEAQEVSSRHAVIRIESDQAFLQDLGSTNGTLLDGREILSSAGEVEIVPGSMLSFAGIPLTRSDGSTVHITPPVVESTPTAGLDVTTEEPFTRGVYRLEEGYSEAAGRRIAAMLSSLSELIASDGSSGRLENLTCEFVSRWIQADRVILLEDSGEGTALEPAGTWPPLEVEVDDIRLSKTILDRVMEERTSVLLVDVGSGSGIASESMIAMQLRSAMAVPLFDNERVRGILYVDTTQADIHYSEDELQVVTATANAVAVKLRNRSMRNELATAARIQRALLPAKLMEIEGFELMARLDTCREVGGDLYHVVPRPEGKVLLALGDVAGKGVPAALAMSACMLLISTLAEIMDSVEEIMDLIHRQLYLNLAREQFITLFLADMDPDTGDLVFVNAGHEPPLIIRRDGTMEELPSCCPPVALLDELECTMARANLGPGDTLAVFSDGIPEATQNGEDFLGLEMVKAILTDNRNDDLKDISDAIGAVVRGYLHGSPASDDVTLMLVRRHDAG